MKKRIITLIITCIFVISIVASAVYLTKNAEEMSYKTAKDFFKTFIVPSLDKEMERRKEIKSLGEPVTGRKTVEIWEDMYEISRQTVEDGKILYLDISTQDIQELVLDNIIDYKIKNDTLYVYSKEGYAVIRQSNVCRVYITIPPEEYEKGYYVDEKGTSHYYSKVEDCDFVRYLSSFDEFLKHEQKILKELAE